MEGTQDLWSFERPYTKANGKSQFRITAESGEVIATGYCKRDENAKLMASAPALRAERDALREAFNEILAFDNVGKETAEIAGAALAQ